MTILGVNTVLTVLLRRSARVVKTRAQHPLFRARQPYEQVRPSPGPGTTVRFVDELDSGALGETDPYGNQTYARYRNGERVTPEEQAGASSHESVHTFFSPRAEFLRQARARLAHNGYNKMALLKFAEEALAQLKKEVGEKGLSRRAIRDAWSFPTRLDRHGNVRYVTVSQRNEAGRFLGIIGLGAMQLRVTTTDDGGPDR